MSKFLRVAITVGCLVSISGCRTSKQGYLAKGNQLFAAGKYPDALLNYRKAIQKDPHYGEAFYRLGLAEIKDQQPREALEAFYRAVQLLPANIDAKEHLGSLTLQYYLADSRRPQNFYNVIKQVSSDLLKANSKSFEGLREKAFLAMTDGRREESIELLRKALEVKPSDAGVTTALIQNLTQTGQGDQAEKLGLDLIQSQKTYGPVYDVLYQWYLKENRPADAENILKTKVSNNPKQAAYLVELAAHYVRTQKSAEMQATLQRVLDDPKDFPQARLSVGDFYLRLRNYPEAARYFEEGARAAAGPQKVLYQKRAADALVAQGKAAEASSTVDQIVEENPKDQDARRVQANMLVKSGKPENIAAGERELQALSQQNPNDASLWLGLGRAEELQGNLDTARSKYLEALKNNKDYVQARYALAEIGLIQKQPDQTLQQADEILKLRPNAPRARLLRAEALSRTGNAASARAELARLIADFPRAAQPQLELGLLALSEKKFQEAEAIFGKLRAAGDPRASVGLARVYTAQKEFDKARAALDEGLKKSNNSALLLAQLGNTEAVAGNYDAALAAFQKLIAVNPKVVRERLQLADVLALKGDDKAALAMYGEAAGLAPSELGPNLQFADALSQAGRIPEARAQYLAILKAHPDDPLALNGMAFFIAEKGGNLDEALGFAQRALQKVPGQPSFSDTIACIYLKKGLRDSALQVFGNLVKKYPNYPAFRYHLGMALLDKGDKKSAREELETALAAHPSRQDAARIKDLLGKIS